MNYKTFCEYIHYEDDGSRKAQNIAVRSAYCKAFRPFFTLAELGHQLSKDHSSIIHYGKLTFKRNKLHEAALESAMSIRGELPKQETPKEKSVTNVLNYDYLVRQNAELKQEIAHLKAKLQKINQIANEL
jgi:hypothetical protein